MEARTVACLFERRMSHWSRQGAAISSSLELMAKPMM
jgi:hypothetical protein